FVCLGQGSKHVPHDKGRLALRYSNTRKVIGACQDGTQIIRWVPRVAVRAFVAEILPAHHAANIESRRDRVEFKRRTRNSRAVWDDGAWNNRPEHLDALGKRKSEEATGQGVQQRQTCIG